MRPTSVARWVASLRAAGGRSSADAASAAVDKIEGKRKPEDFIGHRKGVDTQNRLLQIFVKKTKPSPASATRKKEDHPFGWSFFFVVEGERSAKCVLQKNQIIEPFFLPSWVFVEK